MEHVGNAPNNLSSIKKPRDDHVLTCPWHRNLHKHPKVSADVDFIGDAKQFSDKTD